MSFAQWAPCTLSVLEGEGMEGQCMVGARGIWAPPRQACPAWCFHSVCLKISRCGTRDNKKMLLKSGWGVFSQKASGQVTQPMCGCREHPPRRTAQGRCPLRLVGRLLLGKSGTAGREWCGPACGPVALGNPKQHNSRLNSRVGYR